MRRLAREAVIFTLLSTACVSITIFILMLINPPGWSLQRPTFSESVLAAVTTAGLWGAPAGLSLWVLYRLVRFAIKG
jgi:hypothetical protein